MEWRADLAFDEPLRDVEVSADGASVFVASCHPATGATVDVVDAHSLRVIDTVTLGGEVSQLLVAAAGDRLYAVNGDRIMVLSASTHEVLDSITTVTEPSCIAESPDGSRLFVADYDGTVTALAVAPTTDAMLAKLLASAVIDVPMLELGEPADEPLQFSETEIDLLTTVSTSTVWSLEPSTGPTAGNHWVTCCGLRTLVTTQSDSGPVPIRSMLTV